MIQFWTPTPSKTIPIELKTKKKYVRIGSQVNTKGVTLCP